MDGQFYCQKKPLTLTVTGFLLLYIRFLLEFRECQDFKGYNSSLNSPRKHLSRPCLETEERTSVTKFIFMNYLLKYIENNWVIWCNTCILSLRLQLSLQQLLYYFQQLQFSFQQRTSSEVGDILLNTFIWSFAMSDVYNSSYLQLLVLSLV